jgi:signal transduction histidine kinase/CheY-like chemotaxis protein
MVRFKNMPSSAKLQEAGWTRTDEQMLKLMEAGNLVLSQYDETGRLKYISPEIKRITGIPSADFISEKYHLSDLVHPNDVKALETLKESRAGGMMETKSVDCRIRDQRDNWHWLHFHQRTLTRHDSIMGHETLAVDYTALAELESQKKRASELQGLTRKILESFLSTDDIRATLNRNLEMIGRQLNIDEATIHEFESNDECPLVGRWSSHEHKTSVLTDRQLTNSESMEVRALFEGLTPIRFGASASSQEKRIPGLCENATHCAGVVVPVQVIGKLSLVLTFTRKPHQPWNTDEISALQLIAQSISRRLEREKAVQERNNFDELRRGHERSEIIAHLASGIAHDFNNIVFAISGRIQLLQRRSEDTKTNESLAEIQKTLQGAKGIIGALLAMHKGSPRPSGRVRIKPEVTAMAAMIRRLIPRRIELDLVIKGVNNVEVELGAESLHQILMNLVINARDAINNKGRISITMARIIANDDTPLITIDIDDDGPGIPESMRMEVFQPFVTSKSASRGTGLGLSIVQRVIKEYGGTISLEKSPLGGLRVHIELRIANNRGNEESSSVSEKQLSTPTPSAQLQRVLIVEDDETIKALLTQFFQSIGVTVSSHSNALEVEASLRETTPPFDVLVMDIDLPYKTGIECLKEIRGQGIQTPCVLITGGLSEKPSGITNLGFLRKPFEIDELESLCKELIT